MFLWFPSLLLYSFHTGGLLSFFFFEFILYAATSLKVFLTCRSCLVQFLGSLMYTIISPANNKSLTSSFPIWISFISWCFLITIARTSRTMLKRYGESGQPCLVPDFSGMVLSFSPFNLMLAVSCCILLLLYLGMNLVSLISPRSLS